MTSPTTENPNCKRSLGQRAAWATVEQMPFSEMIQQGSARSVMMGHLIHRNIDSGVPATLSGEWVRQLREDMDWQDGVIVSDDMHMGAILDFAAQPDVVVQSLGAGLDLLVFSNNPAAAQGRVSFTPDEQLPRQLNQLILEKITSGEVSERAVEQSSLRVQNLKRRLVN